MEIISRKYYSEKIDFWLGKETVIILSGQRRVGKSCLLKDFIQRHSASNDANIIYVDKEKRQFQFIENGNQLGDYIEKRYEAKKHNYILIDEVQEIEGWERPICSFRTEPNTDIIITGNNTKMLSSELSTYLCGRYHEILVQSLSYCEFLEFHNLSDSDQSLKAYLYYGGLPGLRLIGLEEEDHVWEYIKDVLYTIIQKDIIERHGIQNIPILNDLIAYYADKIGKMCSAINISRYMKTNQQEIALNEVMNYTTHCCKAHLTATVKRYEIHGRKIFEPIYKAYFCDTGILNLLAGTEREANLENIIENIVYQHLIRMGHQVYVGELQIGNIYFVCTKPNNVKYIQVTNKTHDEETCHRDFERLQSIKNNCQKYVISSSPLLDTHNHDGIIHISLHDFLKYGLQDRP